MTEAEERTDHNTDDRGDSLQFAKGHIVVDPIEMATRPLRGLAVTGATSLKGFS